MTHRGLCHLVTGAFAGEIRPVSPSPPGADPQCGETHARLFPFLHRLPEAEGGRAAAVRQPALSGPAPQKRGGLRPPNTMYWGTQFPLDPGSPAWAWEPRRQIPRQL